VCGSRKLGPKKGVGRSKRPATSRHFCPEGGRAYLGGKEIALDGHPLPWIGNNPAGFLGTARLLTALWAGIMCVGIVQGSMEDCCSFIGF